MDFLFSELLNIIHLLIITILAFRVSGMIPLDKVNELIAKLNEFADKSETPHDNNAVDILEQGIDWMKRLGLLKFEAYHEDAHTLAEQINAERKK